MTVSRRNRNAFSLFCASALLVTALAVSAAADSMDCGTSLVSTGDSKVDVLMKCGEPTFKEEHQEEVADTTQPDLKKKVIITVEEWTFNLGPNRLMRTLEFRNGKLSEIRTGKYGQ